MSLPLQIAVLVLLGAALWSIFYIVNVLSQRSVPGYRGTGGPAREREKYTIQE